MNDGAGQEEELDAGLKSLASYPLRTCIVTREILPQSALIRFVLSPTHEVTPDVLHKLPGRGAWVKADESVIEQAVKKKLFNRAFKKDVNTTGELAQIVVNLLKKATLESLSLTNRAGLVIAGAFKVMSAIEHESICAYLHASNGEEDGFRKIFVGFTRENNQNDNERLHLQKNSVLKNLIVLRAFSSEELGKAIGKEDVVHLVVKSGVAARLFKQRAKQLQYMWKPND